MAITKKGEGNLDLRKKKKEKLKLKTELLNSRGEEAIKGEVLICAEVEKIVRGS